ncbi:hypothetical protein [Desulfosarcina cetonica]|uniref:hypothetical protein n=1 Tax=Desulfosarcina cetonica TaxID=90730 RepID=UPI0012ECBD9D|nr:hypothetical protein [Desulfosarcina cetonica]
MLRRYSLLVLIFLFWIHPAFSAEPVRVLVLPFEIHTSQDLAYLKEDIPKYIREALQAEGAVMVDAGAAQRHEARQRRHQRQRFAKSPLMRVPIMWSGAV